MATIKHVKEGKRKNNNKKYWVFTMDDGTEGFSHKDNPEAPWEYKEGDEVDFVAEKDGEYTLLRFIRKGEAKEPSTRTQEADTHEDTPPMQKIELGGIELLQLKMQLRRDVIKVIGEVAAAGRIEPKEMAEYYNEFYLATDASLDELCK